MHLVLRLRGGAGGAKRVAEEAAAPIDFTPLQSDHPRVKEILELDDMHLVTRFAELSPRSLQSLACSAAQSLISHSTARHCG